MKLEDVFPIENGNFPARHVSLQGCNREFAPWMQAMACKETKKICPFRVVFPRFFQGRTAKLLGFQRRLKLQDFLPSRVSSFISKNLEQKRSNHFWGLWGFNVHLTPGLPYPHSPQKQGFSFGLTEGNPIAMSLLRPFFAAERQNDSKSKDCEPSD